MKKILLTFIFCILFTSLSWSADRYWVGGGSSDIWDATGPTNWSTTSGGTNDASIPTSSDNVFFDAGSAGANVSTGGANPIPCNDLDFTGYTGTLTHNPNDDIAIYGSLTCDAGMTWNFSAISSELHFKATTTGHTITSNGDILGTTRFIGSGGWTLQDAYNVGGKNIDMRKGTLDTNGMTVTCQNFTSNATTTRTITLGASTINASGFNPINFTNSTNLTFNSNTSTINSTNTSDSAKTFAGGDQTFYDVSFTGGGAGAVTITGSNTFNTFTINPPKTITFTSGTTQTVSSFVATGNSDQTITINASTGGSAATLSDSSGTNTVHWCSIQDSTATGGATWDATDNCTDVSGNTGWNFAAATVRNNAFGRGITTGIGRGIR